MTHRILPFWDFWVARQLDASPIGHINLDWRSDCRQFNLGNANAARVARYFRRISVLLGPQALGAYPGFFFFFLKNFFQDLSLFPL